MKHIRHRGAAALLATFIGTLPATAAADQLLDASGQPAKASERLHTVDIEVEPGVAKLQVRRTFANEGRKSLDLIVTVDLPADGVITSVAIDAGEVEAQWLNYDEAALYLPSMPARAQRTVEYTIEVPLASAYDRARIRFVPGEESQAGLAPMLVRHQGQELLPGANPYWREYVVPAPTPEHGQLRWGAHESAQGAIWRVELDAPHSLSEPPSEPLVCFVIDRSRSQTRVGVERQLRILARWAQEQPQARFEVIAHARTAERLFDAPVGAEAILALSGDDPRLELGNGSQLDTALALATEVLADASGSAYLVVLSDAELASRLSAERLHSMLEPLAANTTVHTLINSGRQTYGAIAYRDDALPLAELALAHGGLPLQVLVPDEYPDPEGLIVDNLLRPLQIDKLQVVVDGQPRKAYYATLREHQSHQAMEIAAAVPQTIAVTGQLWAQAWTLAGTRSPAVDRRAAVFATTWFTRELDDAVLEQIGQSYAVATRKTALRAKRSKLAVVPPTPLDIRAAAQGFGGIGRGGGGLEPPATGELAPERLLASFGITIDACIEQHRGPAGSLSLAIETTWDEIVDVVVEGGSPALRECVAESVWQTNLDASYTERRAAGSVVIELPTIAAEQPPAIESKPRGCRLASEPGAGSTILLMLTLLGLGRLRRGD